MRQGRLWPFALVALLGAPAFADDARGAAKSDAGSARSVDQLSEEDREVVENLELLQHLDEAKELDTLLQLAEAEQADGGDEAR